MNTRLNYLGGVIAMANRFNKSDHEKEYSDTYQLCLSDLVNHCTHTDRCDALNEVSPTLAMQMDDAWQKKDYAEFGELVRFAVGVLMANKAMECADNVLSVGD